jgi:hypothetical protein
MVEEGCVNDVLNFGSLKKTEADRVEAYCGDNTICWRCGATLATYPDKCNVPLDAPCPGFLLIEGLRLHFRRTADAA